MRGVIPPGTWYYGSQFGQYNFLYPKEAPDRAAAPIEVVDVLPWLKQQGLTAYRTRDGVIWCEEDAFICR